MLIGGHEASHVFVNKNCSLCSQGLLGILPKPHKMARPKKEVKAQKAIIVSFRLNVDKYLELANNAEALGLTIPQFIRKKISGSVLTRMRYSPIDRKVYVELSRIGNNINQLAKQSHLGMRNPVNLETQLKEIKHLLDELKSKILNYDSQAD